MYASKMESRPRRGFTKADAEDHIYYEPASGTIHWKKRIQCFGGGKPAGSVAGTKKDGYVQIKLFGKVYRAHHIVWLFETGDWPPVGVDVDHIDGNRSNNVFSNLRLATRSQNNLNTGERRRANNTSGHKGVYPTKDGRWFARIGHKGKILHLGTHDTFEEAKAARLKGEKEIYGEFSSQNQPR